MAPRASHPIVRQWQRIIRQVRSEYSPATLRWLLRCGLVTGQKSKTSGFILPTVTLLLLMMSLVVGVLIFRTFTRTSQVIGDRQQRTLYNAATPAIERGKAKLEYLFGQAGLPAIPTDSQISDELAKELYTLPDEVRINLNASSTSTNTTRKNESDFDLDGQYYNFDTAPREDADSAWAYPYDENGDGKEDYIVAYSILHDTARVVDTTGNRSLADAGDNSVILQRDTKTKADALVVRSGPINLIDTSNNTGCPQPSDDPLGGWIPTSNSERRKALQIQAVARNTKTGVAATLEYQQDKVASLGNKWAVWYRYDFEAWPGDGWRLNGATYTDGNYIMTSELSGNKNSNDSVRFYQVSSTSSCFYSPTTAEMLMSENAGGFQGQVVVGRTNTDETQATNSNIYGFFIDPYVLTGTPPSIRVLATADGTANNDITGDSVSDGFMPSSIKLDPLLIWTQDLNQNLTAGNNRDRRDTTNWTNSTTQDHKYLTSRLFNRSEEKPFLDDTYRADDRWGPKPVYNKDYALINTSSSGQPITDLQDNQNDLRQMQPIDPLDETDGYGFDGYWERRARDRGVRIIVGQRLELGNPYGWKGYNSSSPNSDSLYPAANNAAVGSSFDEATANYDYNGDGDKTDVRTHEQRQWKALVDNLAAVQATAVYHYKTGLYDSNGDGTLDSTGEGYYPLACVATTAHPGTNETDANSRTFNQSTTNTSTFGVNFLEGRGTNGWEFAPPPQADFETNMSTRSGPWWNALSNLAYFAGTPDGGAPSFPPVAGTADPYMDMWGDFSMLRQIMDDLRSGSINYSALSLADKTTLQTAGCTMGMLAYSLKTWVSTLSAEAAKKGNNNLTSLGGVLYNLMDGDETGGATVKEIWKIFTTNFTGNTYYVAPGTGDPGSVTSKVPTQTSCSTTFTSACFHHDGSKIGSVTTNDWKTFWPDPDASKDATDIVPNDGYYQDIMLVDKTSDDWLCGPIEAWDVGVDAKIASNTSITEAELKRVLAPGFAVSTGDSIYDDMGDNNNVTTLSDLYLQVVKYARTNNRKHRIPTGLTWISSNGATLNEVAANTDFNGDGDKLDTSIANTLFDSSAALGVDLDGDGTITYPNANLKEVNNGAGYWDGTKAVTGNDPYFRSCDSYQVYNAFNYDQYYVALTANGKASDLSAAKTILVGLQLTRDRRYGFRDDQPPEPTSTTSTFSWNPSTKLVEPSKVQNETVSLISGCDPDIFQEYMTLADAKGTSTNNKDALALAVTICGEASKVKYPSLYYLFPYFNHDYNGANDSSTANIITDHRQPDGTFALAGNSTAEHYIAASSVIAANPTTAPGATDADSDNKADVFRVVDDIGGFVPGVEDGSENSLDEIDLVPKLTDFSDWVTPNLGTYSPTQFNQITAPNGVVRYVSLLDTVIFDGREHMPVRVLNIDLNLMRQRNVSGGACTFTAPASDTSDSNGNCWLPLPTIQEPVGGTTQTGAIVYAFREDAVREDNIVRTAASAWANCDTYSELITATCRMNTSTSVDPPVHGSYAISTKPVDMYADPDRRPYGFLLFNGSDLRRLNSGTAWTNDNSRGISFISDQPVYLEGNFNLHQNGSTKLEEFTTALTSNWSNFYTRTGNSTTFATAASDQWRLTEVVADSITILSSSFCPGFIDLGITDKKDCNDNGSTTAHSFMSLNEPTLSNGSGSTSPWSSASITTWLRADGTTTSTTLPIQISRDGFPMYLDGSTPKEYGKTSSVTQQTFDTFRDRDISDTTVPGVPGTTNLPRYEDIGTATTTTINATLVANVTPSAGKRPNGGVTNFMRLSENWNNIDLEFSGSLIQLNFNTYATGLQDPEDWEFNNAANWSGTNFNTFYLPPNRKWGFDVALLKVGAGPVADRFRSRETYRSEFYRELPLDDPYILNLRCARIPKLTPNQPLGTNTYLTATASVGTRIDPTVSSSSCPD